MNLPPEAKPNRPFTIPNYAKASLLLIGLYYLVSMLSIAQGLILPIVYATIIAILISPVVNYLVKKKANRAISIAIVMIISILIVAGLVAVLSSQATRFADAVPRLVNKFQELLDQGVDWYSSYFNISVPKINKWIASTMAELMSQSNAAIGNTITTMGSVLSITLLTSVYTVMILFYQPHLVAFTHRVFGSYNDKKTTEIMTESKSIIQNYLVGLFLEFLIISALNAVGLLILGIEYAIILGILGALLNVIPYLGGAITVVLFMVIALVTKSPVYSLYVLALYVFIQSVDNNYIVPKIIGSKVKLNALVSLFAVIAGAALWGIPGMFLSIPLTAVIKLILDRIDDLKPWGFLLGDTMPPIIDIKLSLKEITKKIPSIKPKPKN